MLEPIAAHVARSLIRKLVLSGSITYTDHAAEEMGKEEPPMTIVDCVNVLKGGAVNEAEFENGAWRHHVRTSRMTVVVEFDNDDQDANAEPAGLVIVTAWRN